MKDSLAKNAFDDSMQVAENEDNVEEVLVCDEYIFQIPI